MLLGNVGQDPEINTFGESGKIAKFSIATSYNFKDKEGNTLQKTSWHKVTAFSKLAEVAEKLVKKGASVYVEGRIEYQQYVNKDGLDVNSTDLIDTLDKLDIFKYPKTKPEEPEES
ncbi:Single-stranded DNA-binding protein [Smittium mucronatum]|uniref:Single-stranded DNA-binding protein n=1 Tax=Smittium mucronatum TaxID=133383 RepID=A0A1R0H5J1_9FUNG|nr:Single-stranded DNA-binding protein [Smittium mucronatum]